MTLNWLSVAIGLQDNLTSTLHALGAIGSLFNDLFVAMRPAMAPKRKRPRRVQRKIDARNGYQHYQVAALRRRWALVE